MTDTPTTRPLVLVADDMPGFRDAFAQMLRMRGYDVDCVGEAETIATRVAARQYDLLTLDLNWEREDLDGIGILRRVLQVDPLLPIIVVTGEGTIPTAIEATRLGAFDYIEKFQDREKTILTLKNAIDSGRLRRANQVFLNELKSAHRLVGTSAALVRLRQHIEQVGATDSTVLLTGRSGTGKELVARQLHYASPRRQRAFVSVDAGVLSDDLAASELFGHRRGAFTGAHADRTGLVREAEGGTLFLDEISSASLDLQKKLLRLLQERQYRRVGDSETQPADVRIIAASNQDLPGLIRERKFREDLYYRLNVIEITIPPLDERREDIPLLAAYFTKAKSLRCCGREKTLTPESINLLVQRDWPGNVRELEHTIERIVILSQRETISPEEVCQALGEPYGCPGNSELQTLNEMTQDFRRQCIIKALNLADGKVQHAASILGIDRTHLYRLMKEFDLTNRTE